MRTKVVSGKFGVFESIKYELSMVQKNDRSTLLFCCSFRCANQRLNIPFEHILAVSDPCCYKLTSLEVY